MYLSNVYGIDSALNLPFWSEIGHPIFVPPLDLFQKWFNKCNGTDGWTGPLACLSLSSVSWVDKEQLPQSGIRPLPCLFLSQIIDVLRVKKFLWAHFWVQLLTVTTAWNTVETGDKYIWLSRFCTARRSNTGYCRVGPTKVEAYKSLVVTEKFPFIENKEHLFNFVSN